MQNAIFFVENNMKFTNAKYIPLKKINRKYVEANSRNNEVTVRMMIAFNPIAGGSE